MGGCASRPKEFDAAAAPPAEAPETTDNVVAAQDGGEAEKEKEAPLVDLSEPAAEAAPAPEKEEDGEKEEKEEDDAETKKKAEGEGEAAPSS